MRQKSYHQQSRRIRLSEKKIYLSKHKRHTEEVNFNFTARDLAILEALNRYRYLRTNQIKRLVFTENTTLQSTRRRLKYLFHNGFIGRVIPFVQIGEGSSETAYFLDKSGGQALQAETGTELLAYAKGSQVKHQFLDHALDLSEFRVNLELALKDHALILLRRFVADFEIKGNFQKALGQENHKLFQEVSHPVSKVKYVVYPDALFIFQGQGELEKYQSLYFLEIDRGTESLNVIRNKVIGYNIYRNERLFTKFGKFAAFRVLLQTHSEKRAQNIRQHLTDQEGSELIWVTSQPQVNEVSIIKDSIWLNHTWELKSILRIK